MLAYIEICEIYSHAGKSFKKHNCDAPENIYVSEI